MNSPTNNADNNGMLTEAILLLCGHFNTNDTKNIKPFTPSEYSRLALWLHQHKYTPADLLTQKEELLDQWIDPRSDFKNPITRARLQGLLGRAASMGFAIEKWQQQNVQIISRAGRDYPKIIRETFTDTRPPLLYCIGNKELLANKGIGFVGSRKIVKEDEIATQGYVKDAVSQGYMIVSGAAKGVDETAMVAALDAGGTAIGVVADSLLKTATNQLYRKAIIEGRLLLMSTSYPEARFSTGLAMARNKYIYVLSEGVVVIKSGTDGGTWTGALENFKKQWVPLLVRNIEEAGNQLLIEKGGIALQSQAINFSECILKNDQTAQIAAADSNPNIENIPALDLFPEPLKPAPKVEPEADVALEEPEQKNESKPSIIKQSSLTLPIDSLKAVTNNNSDDFKKVFKHYGDIFHLFYEGVVETNSQFTEITADLLLEKYPELKKAQISEWLKQLEAKGFLVKPTRKLTYRLADKASIQGLL